MTHPKVKQAYVIGLPDTVKGEVPVAAVELQDGEAISAAQLRSFCRGRIASYKIPTRVIFLGADEFPRTSTGKVQKTELRAVIAARLQPSIPPGTGEARRCAP
jgi:acyl-CoA synthetase (AMP-forming)/AMP-acid ligase II